VSGHAQGRFWGFKKLGRGVVGAKVGTLFLHINTIIGDTLMLKPELRVQ
jgi:hypothetical protein